MMKFPLSSHRLLDPNTDGGGGGNLPAGSPPSAGDGGNGGGNSDFVPRADFDRAIQSINGLSQKFEGFHQDYSRRFAPAGGGKDEGAISQEPNLAEYSARLGNTNETVTKYLADFNRFHTKKNWDGFQSDSQKTQSAQAAKAKRQSSLQAHVGRMSEAMQRYKDFDQVTSNAPGPLPSGENGQPDVLSDVLESEHSADLQYHLSKNPGDYWKLINAYNQSERQGARFLGALESKFTGEAAERKKNLRQSRGGVTADAGGEIEGGNGDDDTKYASMARESFGLKKSKKE